MHVALKPIVNLSLAAVLAVIVFNTVSAQETAMTEDQMSRIRSSCVGAKNTMNQLHANDALLRINRGQMYESILTKLMVRFNGRAEGNGLNIGGLSTVVRNYQASLTKFRDDYISYEVQLYAAINIDCFKEPVSFYDAVANARIKRAQVHSDVTELHGYIDSYQAAFNSFAIDFNKPGGASKQ